MNTRSGVAVVFWGPHSISTEMFARRLHATLYLIHYLSWKRPWIAPFKYPPMWLKTWWVLFKQRPSAVLVVNTPVFAPLCVYFYCLFARIPFAMNVHGHTLGGRRWGWSVPIQKFLAKRAVVNLVGTDEYEMILKNWGAQTLFLEDPPPHVPEAHLGMTPEIGGYRVTVVSTFAGDEPLEVVIEAARRLPEVCFYITGDTKLADHTLLESAPRNVTFTGYLRGDAYWGQLYSSNAIMTLTTNPHSLVAGGLEGMYAGKPLILSRQPALLDYFTKGTVFVDHTVESLVDGLRRVRAREDVLSLEAAALASEKDAQWSRAFKGFQTILEGAHG